MQNSKNTCTCTIKWSTCPANTTGYKKSYRGRQQEHSLSHPSLKSPHWTVSVSRVIPTADSALTVKTHQFNLITKLTGLNWMSDFWRSTTGREKTCQHHNTSCLSTGINQIKCKNSSMLCIRALCAVTVQAVFSQSPHTSSVMLYKIYVGECTRPQKKRAMFWNSTHIPELLQSFRKRSHSSKHMWNYQGKSSWSPA